MEIQIGGESYSFDNNIRSNTARRQSFDALAQATFGGLTFEEWYQNGYWGGEYIPYTLSSGGEVVANASVNIIDTIWQGSPMNQGSPKRFVQIGTVMTAEGWRGRGLSRWLLEKILADWRDACDMIYLYANDSVVDFYPRMGFEKAQEYVSRMPLIPRGRAVPPLDLNAPADLAALRRLYGQSNHFSALPMRNCWGLLLFWCTGPQKGCVYHLLEYDAVVIAEPKGETLLCHDIYGGREMPLFEALAAVAPAGCKTVEFGFALKDAPESTLVPLVEEDTTLFVLAGKENIFAGRRTRMPNLSRA